MSKSSTHERAAFVDQSYARRCILTVGLSALGVAVLATSCTTSQPAQMPAAPLPTASSAPAPVPAAPHGLVVPPNGGERFTYCARPLTLMLKVDSVSAPVTQLVAGTGSITGDEGVGRHRTAEEVVYVRSGWGYAVFAADTQRLAAGSVVYVPPGVSHRFISAGAAPLEYFWVNGPATSGAAFRRAASIGCPGGPPATVSAPVADTVRTRALVLPPGDGERITYCLFPLTITPKVDSQSIPSTRLLAATGALRRGSEIGTHTVDEVVLITHGHGRAFSGPDTVAVEEGSITWTPRGLRHGFINDGDGTLEYFIVYGPYPGARSRAGFRSLARRPGPFCPSGSPP